ncbi:TIGR03643 family protein [Akkermansiaceae bacterium]|nr:TIGR03643 family protein [Akkermansiaceae bacterium]MDB4300632.1 TIGR03643 family protein [bacterium]MDB4452112.1 TIGR03643 family protein [Akkermansiaceae bacterium]
MRMAWEDRTTFDEIKKKTGYRKGDVIKVMRGGLKASSFRRWRKRVSGRVTKHWGLFEKSRAEIKEGRGRQVDL